MNAEQRPPIEIMQGKPRFRMEDGMWIAHWTDHWGYPFCTAYGYPYRPPMTMREIVAYHAGRA